MLRKRRPTQRAVNQVLKYKDKETNVKEGKEVVTVKNMTARFCWDPKNKANDKYAYFNNKQQQTIRRK